MADLARMDEWGLAAIGDHLRVARLDSAAFVVGVLVLAAAPQLHYLHGRGAPEVLSVAETLQARTLPAERLLSNSGILLAIAPQVGFHAGRDVSYDAVTDTAPLQAGGSNEGPAR